MLMVASHCDHCMLSCIFPYLFWIKKKNWYNKNIDLHIAYDQMFTGGHC